VRALQLGREGSGPLGSPIWRHPGVPVAGGQECPPSLFSGIEWAADAEAGFVEDVGVDLGGGDVSVTVN